MMKIDFYSLPKIKGLTTTGFLKMCGLRQIIMMDQMISAGFASTLQKALVIWCLDATLSLKMVTAPEGTTKYVPTFTGVSLRINIFQPRKYG